MSPVEFKKTLCHPIDYKGQGPLLHIPLLLCDILTYAQFLLISGLKAQDAVTQTKLVM